MRTSSAVFGLFLLLTAVPASAQTYYPGSLWTSNGTLSPAEPGNTVSLSHFEQGIARRGAELFAQVTATADTAGFDWNRRVVQGVGVRFTQALPGGMIRASLSYLSERRFVEPRTMNGVAITLDAYFGWRQRAPVPVPPAPQH